MILLYKNISPFLLLWRNQLYKNCIITHLPCYFFFFCVLPALFQECILQIRRTCKSKKYSIHQYTNCEPNPLQICLSCFRSTIEEKSKKYILKKAIYFTVIKGPALPSPPPIFQQLWGRERGEKKEWKDREGRDFNLELLLN